MNPRFLLDTSICIYMRRRRPPEILQQFLRLQVGEAAISVVTFGELIYGAPPRVISARRRCGSLKNLSLSYRSYQCRWMLAAATALFVLNWKLIDVVIGNNDLWIAAHAKAAKLIFLVTNNEREFQRVSGLEIQNWAKI